LLNTEEGALAQAQDTLAQVTDLHGRVLSLVEPQNRLNYEELWQRIRTISDLAQKHDTQLLEVDGDLRKLLPLIPRTRDHTQDILALWVHLRDALDVVDHGWRDTYGVPSTEGFSPRYLHPTPLSLPANIHLQAASAENPPDVFDFYFAPTVQPLPVGSRIPTPTVTPTFASGGGQAQDSQTIFSDPADLAHLPHRLRKLQIRTASKPSPPQTTEEAEVERPPGPAQPFWYTHGNWQVDLNPRTRYLHNISFGPSTNQTQQTQPQAEHPTTKTKNPEITPAENQPAGGASTESSSPESRNPLASGQTTLVTSTFSAFEQRAEQPIVQKHQPILDDPMDIEEAIASARKLHTPNRLAKDQLHGEGAGPSGLTPEALLPGLPAGAAVPAGPSKKGRAKPLVEVPPRAPRPQRKAATIYSSLNEAAMRKQNAQRTTAPQAADSGKSNPQPDSEPKEPRLCAPMTGIRDDFAEALWAFDHPSSDDEGPAVAAVAPVSNRDENGYMDDAAAYKLCCGPFSDEEEQGPVSEQADSLSDSLAEFYSDPLISAAVAASAAVPDKPAESAAESAVPAKPTPTTNTPAAESATTADTTAVAAASKSQTKNKNKRRSGRSRRRSKSQRRQAKAAAALAAEEEDVEWPCSC
jgi:hypothetical protein